MREQDVKDLKEGIKELQKTLHQVDKEVSVHTVNFKNLGNVKELSERTDERSKSAHKRIDEVEDVIDELKNSQEKQFKELKESQEKQYKDFRSLVEESNKTHKENYQGIKTLAWKVFFLFASPFAVGFVGIFWFIYQKGLGIK
ncbi:hypothetical protein [Peribacillus muralis]|uniref:hypothetical protein n=1 Tax=Peribacillus muralis TaxID=264697 RepID=UPI003D085459